jgi:tRNA-Thr(GGU) m(6)t(6)A37 methyltransferase TsaA
MVAIKEISLKPIGYVQRVSKDEDVKDRNLVSNVVVYKDLLRALEGIQDFSHLFIIFYMHEVAKVKRANLKVHPRGRIDMPLVGIFATRTAFRPNPIGLTLVELIKREDNVLVVRGLDALDGTPILDVKPVNDRDVALNPRIPLWLKLLESEKHGPDGTEH